MANVCEATKGFFLLLLLEKTKLKKFEKCKMCDAFPVSCCRPLQVKDPLASAGGVASSLGRIGKTKAQCFFVFFSRR